MKEERIYQSLFENSAQGMVLLQDEKVILVNQSFCDMVGYANDEILNFSVVEMFSLVHSPDCDQELKRLRNLLAGKETSRNYTCRFIRRSGETGWWSVMLSRIEHQGHPSILGVFADITERKSAEKALERGFTLLNATLDVLPM